MGDLAGRVVLDCTNPLAPDLSGLVAEPSGGEHVASRAVGARGVKVFNTTGAGNMGRAGYPEGPASMLLCGDDAAARETAAGLAADLGFEPVDAGGLEAAPLLESLALLWIRLAMRQGLGTDIAFRLMKR
jgi:predicted dinucleotide-binding enzyme